MKLNLAEGVALYLAARLLTQIHDERNEHVLSALSKLISGMPATMAPNQRALLDLARERQKGQPDRSDIFETLALGWATHRIIRLTYAPPHRKTFESQFSPYLLEPSAIGRTFYAIGHSNPPDALRTFKMERIEYAKLTEESFEVPQDFDGPALLKRAWGVMYGDEEPIEVRLRFSHWVTKRVKETLWHPSQQITETSDGCEWTAQIGDTLEIENWIRGWGSDCEVLAPQELREKMIKEARRLAHMYGITNPQTQHHQMNRIWVSFQNSGRVIYMTTQKYPASKTISEACIRQHYEREECNLASSNRIWEDTRGTRTFHLQPCMSR